MDDFIVYGNTFKEALENLEKFSIKFQETNLALSNKKSFMLQIKGIVLGHSVSSACIKVDPTNIEVVSNILVPKTQKDVRSFLGHVGYYI